MQLAIFNGRKINTDRHVAYVPGLDIEAVDNGEAGFGSRSSSNCSEPGLESGLRAV